MHIEVLAAGAVRFIAEGCDCDESGVLAGGCRDEHVVVGTPPVEGRS
jgi:hypothetical protein